VHGAIGISAEYDLQLHTRRLQASRLACGGEAAWNSEIGKAVLESDSNALEWLRENLSY